MKYVLLGSNNQVIHYNLTKEEAERWKEIYESIYPQEKMKIKEQWW